MKIQTYNTIALLVASVTLGIISQSCSVEKATDSRTTPGFNSNGLTVPDGFVIEQAATADMVSYPMFATLDNQGRLFVIESSGKTTSTEDVLRNPTFEVRFLEDLNGDGIYDRHKVFADKIPYPMGGTFYKGSFYVAAPPDLIRFTDTDGDGDADKREVILTGWTLNHNAATLSGPFLGPDGWLYMCDARRGFNIKTKEGTTLKGKGARIWRCRPDGTDLEFISGGGFDNTIEMIFMPSGETIGTMTYFTEPKDGQRDALIHWVEGGVYPKPYGVIEEDRLKLTGELMPVMTKLPRVSPAGLMRYRGSVFGEGYDNNLFSAEFNTGRIMRHIVKAEGASFTTVNEVFMKSDSLDTHPTDVLQDADGSLIVVNTGGWFIAGCPLSVVAKTDIRGGIFRIRKTDAVIKDPWGKQIDLKTMSLSRLSKLTTDPRPFVVDNVFEQMILLGEPAVENLTELLSSDSESLRVASVFALYRIGTEPAIKAILSAMKDKSELVRISGARVLGLAKASMAVDKLSEIVQKDNPAVRRQAATALGQIGDARAIPALISASSNPEDRFVEHAIRYSMISLGVSEPMIKALKHSSANVRATALVVLDQMDKAPLKKEHLVPFVLSSDEHLQETGIWVASHHAEWTDVILSYLEKKFSPGTLSEKDRISIADLMVSFSGHKQIQDFVAARLRDHRFPIASRLVLLDAVRRSSLNKLPASWVNILGNLLQAEDTLSSAVLQVLQSRSTPELSTKLTEIALSPGNSERFRLKALGARIMSVRRLSAPEFMMLTDFINADHEAPIRQLSAQLLAQAELTDSQLLTIAAEKIRTSDTYLLPALVKCFHGNKSEAVGKALITALLAEKDRLDYFSITDVENIISTFPTTVRASAIPLVENLRDRQKIRLSQLHALEATLKTKGDVATGRNYFFGKALCSSCHAVEAKGGTFGPDLTNIGQIRSQHDILEAIVFPSASFAREYETSKVVTKTNTYTGIIKTQLPQTVSIETGPGIVVTVARDEIVNIEQLNVSLMPPGLHQQLTSDEMTDLMTYLTTLPDGLGHLN